MIRIVFRRRFVSGTVPRVDPMGARRAGFARVMSGHPMDERGGNQRPTEQGKNQNIPSLGHRCEPYHTPRDKSKFAFSPTPWAWGCFL
ncbi:MAG: hypothetical protein EOM72_01180 [Opitutae bacterium]|nr:hypothetical protein [Opitutae bacterium]